jgi:long-subunit acyl-CoA synthetase (AMP-forming)
VRIVLSLSHLRERLEHVAARLVCLDEVEAIVATMDRHRLTDAETGEPVDELCYIYTSGSTGRPKGVAIRHADRSSSAASSEAARLVTARGRLAGSARGGAPALAGRRRWCE